VFVQYSTTVPVGLGAVETQLSSLHARMGEMADLAYREGEDLRSKVGPVSALAKSVALEVGTPQIQRKGLVYPLRWSAVGAEALFPELLADLVLSHSGMEQTTITIVGTYDPPLGVVGRVLDRAVLGRVAEATVRDWLDRLADLITLGVAESPALARFPHPPEI
jgi:hypothetical protein